MEVTSRKDRGRESEETSKERTGSRRQVLLGI